MLPTAWTMNVTEAAVFVFVVLSLACLGTWISAVS
jgi:hypothetical protein